MLSRHRCVAPCVALLCPLVALAGWGGPLNPPAGPIAPTAKPLAEVEPRTAINATNTPGDADSLFRITQPGSYYLTGNVDGVAGKKGIEVAAGDITIDLAGFALRGIPGSLAGIDCVFAGVVVRNGLVTNWGGTGIVLADRARVESVTAHDNTGTGVTVGFDSLVTGSVFSQNGGFGIEIAGCCATIVGCQVGSNASTGIFASSSTTIADCTITDNNFNGVTLGSNAIITRCAVTFNTNDGIFAGTRNVIAENSIAFNSAAGIHVVSNDCRIENNKCTGNVRGIDVDAPGNILVRNTCSGNGAN